MYRFEALIMVEHNVAIPSYLGNGVAWVIVST